MSEAAKPTFGEYLTVTEAAEFLGVSPWTLRNWDNAGKLKPDRHPINGYRIYRRENLESLLTGTLLGKRKGTLAPNFDWDAIGASEHFVQFYESDGYLVESVAGFLDKGLR
ncbi:MAG TPA: MerR family DNA-binding transcriptional regulator, partial [Lacipirellulaceae bacterium]